MSCILTAQKPVGLEYLPRVSLAYRKSFLPFTVGHLKSAEVRSCAKHYGLRATSPLSSPTQLFVCPITTCEKRGPCRAYTHCAFIMESTYTCRSNGVRKSVPLFRLASVSPAPSASSQRTRTNRHSLRKRETSPTCLSQSSEKVRNVKISKR